MDLLEKVEKALAELHQKQIMETPVTLTFSDLVGIRRDILIANYGNDISGANLRAGLEHGKLCKQSIQHHKKS